MVNKLWLKRKSQEKKDYFFSEKRQTAIRREIAERKTHLFRQQSIRPRFTQHFNALERLQVANQRIIEVTTNEINRRRRNQHITQSQQTTRYINQAQTLTIIRTRIKRLSYVFRNILANVSPTFFYVYTPEPAHLRNVTKTLNRNAPIKNDVDMPAMTHRVLFVHTDIRMILEQVTHITTIAQLPKPASHNPQRQTMFGNRQSKKPQTPTAFCHSFTRPTDTQRFFHGCPANECPRKTLVHNVCNLTRLREPPPSDAGASRGNGPPALLK